MKCSLTQRPDHSANGCDNRGQTGSTLGPDEGLHTGGRRRRSREELGSDVAGEERQADGIKLRELKKSRLKEICTESEKQSSFSHLTVVQ